MGRLGGLFSQHSGKDYTHVTIYTMVVDKICSLRILMKTIYGHMLPWKWRTCHSDWIHCSNEGHDRDADEGWKSWQHRIKLHFFKFCAIDLNIYGQRVFLCYFKGWKQQHASLFKLFWFSSNLMCCLQISESSICSEAVTKALTNNRGAALLDEFLSGADGQKTSKLFASPENGMTASNFHMLCSHSWR